LLATDGSPEAETAIGTAATLSERLDAELHLVSVEPMPDPLSWPEARTMSPELRGDIRERAEEAARTKLDAGAEKVKKLGVADPILHPVAGRPDAEIVHVAEEVGAGLVIVGSRGLGPVRRAVMGSVSLSVVHHSHGSVLVVRGDDVGLSGPILLAVDGSEQARVAADAAAELSASTGSGLHVVFVMPTAAHLYGHHYHTKELSIPAGAGRGRGKGVPRRAGRASGAARWQGKGHAHGRRQARRVDRGAGRGTGGGPDRRGQQGTWRRAPGSRRQRLRFGGAPRPRARARGQG
jgi:nucleotide-binding universal stress UspA family protein